MKKFLGSVVIILGIVSTYLFCYTGSYLDRNGANMKQTLKSKGGESVAEFYYQDMGEMNSGLGGLCYAFGVGTLAISIGLGGILLTSSNKSKLTKEV